MTEARAVLSVGVSFDRSAGGEWSGRYSSETQAVLEYPFDSVTVSGTHVAVVLGGGDTTFAGQLAGDSISGTFKDSGGTGSFVFRRTTPPKYPYTSNDITFHNGNVRLAGSVYVPRTPGRHTAVVLLHGSGPETRWGTSRFIADKLARSGIAALIYDKRGSGESGGDWRTASYADLADDAIGAMHVLANTASVDPAKIGLWGHSQGGYIAPLVASRSGRVAFIVAADSPASHQYEQDIYRVRNEVNASGWPAKSRAAAMVFYQHFVTVARTGKGYDDFQAEMKRDEHEPWLSWMAIPPPDSWVWPWYLKTGDYDSRRYWPDVKSPVLLMYGERDSLEPVDWSIATIERLLNSAGNPRVSAIILPGAPHILHIAPAPGDRFFWWHMVPGYPDFGIAWIKRLF